MTGFAKVTIGCAAALAIAGIALYSCEEACHARLTVPRKDTIAKESSRLDPAVALPTAGQRAAVPAPQPPSRRVGELPPQHIDAIAEVNRVLKESGRQPIAPTEALAPTELELLTDMVKNCNAEINLAAEKVLDHTDNLAKRMAQEILACVKDGKPVPYEALPRGILPPREPYDLFVTTTHMGVVYLARAPKTQAALDVVDSQRMAERLRLDAYTSFAERVRQK
jgi:hypothetical protein